MKNDTLIRVEGMEVLMKNLGLVEAERFIMLIQRGEPFDYTRWRKDQFNDEDYEAVYAEAVALYERNRTFKKAKASSAKAKDKAPSRKAKTPISSPRKAAKHPTPA